MFNILIGLLVLFLTACTTQTDIVRQYIDPNISSKPHTLLAGEQIQITVFGQADLSAAYRIDDKGQINMPLLGSILALNKTPAQFADYIAFLLAQNFIRNPSVSVEVITYTPIFVIGAVKNAGQYAYIPGITAEAAIASAGGFLTGAMTSMVKITRRNTGRIFEANVVLETPLAAGDIIRVYGNMVTTQY
ncbi:MAG: polysaccharide export protein [Rhizobiales bacterium]|nr:polysaccharide export protein [Hyphomicrobiales bacterium]NRB14758.1 polysaccharide export protein [Hyphomicrobiales bacterium]